MEALDIGDIHKTLMCERITITKADGNDAPTVRGVLTKFNVADKVGDIIKPSAIKNMSQIRADGGLPMFWQHNPADTIGKWTKIKREGDELIGEGYISQATQRAQEAAALIEEGTVRGLSLGFRLAQGVDWDKAIEMTNTGAVFKAIDLFEASIVSQPAHPNAQLQKHLHSVRNVYNQQSAKVEESIFADAVVKL